MKLPGGLLPVGGESVAANLAAGRDVDGISVQRLQRDVAQDAVLQDVALNVALNREFSFVPDTGVLSVSLQDSLQHCADNGLSQPHWVSRVLVQILASLAGEVVTGDQHGLERVRDLCVADRQYILLQWRIRYESPLQWLTARCGECDACYDFPLDWRQLPVKPAGPLFPYAVARTSQGERLLRVPTGRDQEWLAASGADTGVDAGADDSVNDLRRQLARRLIVGGPGDTVDIDSNAITDDDIEAIELALEEAAPELPDRLDTRCPECGSPQWVALDLYEALAKPVAELLDEVHELAVHYHWSEGEILKLPRQRRKQYLARLDRDRGFRGASL